MHAEGRTLIIRTDASTEIGTGHVMRCIALAEAWRARGGIPRFLSVDMPRSIRSRAEEAGFEIEDLRVERGTPRDVDATIQSARAHAATWVVADGYAFDAVWQRRVRDAGVRLLVIDDYAHLPTYDADILMNQNVGTTRSIYADLSPTCECLFGNRYALLREEFLAIT
ncbi:MAG: hypothetical protein MI757_03045, partial [Pirellulales bacterium]|nr:hypothetical protein [Pirellulales bacterium]